MNASEILQKTRKELVRIREAISLLKEKMQAPTDQDAMYQFNDRIRALNERIERATLDVETARQCATTAEEEECDVLLADIDTINLGANILYAGFLRVTHGDIFRAATEAATSAKIAASSAGDASNKAKETADKADKAQGLQLTVFSAVLTILAFILNNAKILADGISLKGILLVNISFLLAVLVMFGIAYMFLYRVFHVEKIRGGIGFYMSCVAVLLTGALFIVSELLPVTPPVQQRHPIIAMRLSDGVVDERYSESLESTGLDAEWFVVGDGLPDGLKLDRETGVIHGTPVESGKYSFSVIATNRAGDDIMAFYIEISPEQHPIIAMHLPDGTVDVKYSASLEATGLDVEWFVIGGGLPEGLQLDRETGIIHGTPIKPGRYGFSIRARNRTGDNIAAFSITILPSDRPAQ